MFVQASFDQAVNPAAYLVPQSAVMRDIGGDAFVYVVAPGDKAARRKVTADRAMGPNWVVTSGLKPGDRVITQGLAMLKHGMAIKPVLASTPQRVVAPTAGSGGGSASGPGRG
jgi:membrane fusion protein (multidrug efflux system)